MKEANAAQMFARSACPDHSDPDLDSLFPGPFCENCAPPPTDPRWCCPAGRTVVLEDDSIRNAVQEYVNDRNGAIEKYGPINCWNTSLVTTTSFLFAATEFNEEIHCWDVSNVIDFSRMFLDAHRFDQDISVWDVSSAEDMTQMFLGAIGFYRNMCDWGEKLYQKDVTTKKMFMDTMCPEPYNMAPLDSPDTSDQTAGFCGPCDG